MIENAPANPQPTQTSEVTEKKSGNVTIGQLAARFSAAERSQLSAESVVAAPAAEALAVPVQETALTVTATAPAEAGAEGTALTAPEPTAPAETEADDVLSHSTAFSPEQQEIFNRKMAKERALRLDLARELAETKARLGEVAAQPPPAQDLPPVTLTPTPDQPLAHITDLNALQKEFDQTKAVKRMAEQGLRTTGIEINGMQIGDKVYSKDQLNDIVFNATVALEDKIPARANFLQQKQAYDASAYQKFPFLTDKKSPEYQLVQATLRNPSYSWLHNVPQAMEIMGIQVLGMRALNAQLAAAKANGATVPAKAQPPKPPASQTAMGAATGTVRQSTSSITEQKLANERKQLSVKGGVTGSEVARYLSQRDQLSQTRS